MPVSPSNLASRQASQSALADCTFSQPSQITQLASPFGEQWAVSSWPDPWDEHGVFWIVWIFWIFWNISDGFGCHNLLKTPRNNSKNSKNDEIFIPLGSNKTSTVTAKTWIPVVSPNTKSIIFVVLLIGLSTQKLRKGNRFLNFLKYYEVFLMVLGVQNLPK